jgi:hypothetical protein
MREGIDYTREFTEEQQERLLAKTELMVDMNDEGLTDEQLEDYGRRRYGSYGSKR